MDDGPILILSQSWPKKLFLSFVFGTRNLLAFLFTKPFAHTFDF